jgi:3-oxoacyl-(acyl-carrier-protein) synthase
LAINAPKSLLGHPCWSAAIVETVMAIAQMNAGVLHPSINIENLDPQIDLPIVRTMSYKKDIQYILKNSFGFGGINCVSLLKKFTR